MIGNDEQAPRRARCRRTTPDRRGRGADDRPPAIVLGPSEGHDAIEDRADLWRSGAARARERQADAARPAGLRRRVVEPAEPGRGINLFKTLRRNFRATVACRGDTWKRSALMLESDATRRVSKHAPAGCHGRELRIRRNPGRGINLFKALRRILRALVMPQGRAGRWSASTVIASEAWRSGGRRTLDAPLDRDVALRAPRDGVAPWELQHQVLLRGARGFRRKQNPGREFNHFSILQRDFRAAEERRAEHRLLRPAPRDPTPRAGGARRRQTRCSGRTRGRFSPPGRPP